MPQLTPEMIKQITDWINNPTDPQPTPNKTITATVMRRL